MAMHPENSGSEKKILVEVEHTTNGAGTPGGTEENQTGEGQVETGRSIAENRSDEFRTDLGDDTDGMSGEGSHGKAAGVDLRNYQLVPEADVVVFGEVLEGNPTTPLTTKVNVVHGENVFRIRVSPLHSRRQIVDLMVSHFAIWRREDGSLVALWVFFYLFRLDEGGGGVPQQCVEEDEDGLLRWRVAHDARKVDGGTEALLCRGRKCDGLRRRLGLGDNDKVARCFRVEIVAAMA
ncbi:hypothetical protein V8G54_010711 [Vigna mungo]|uniref:Uncharacterized protein n=1 Tax=Vigna mungo TaxID=3915 RepID=A0AAQ3NX58_VIGMU